MSFIVVQNFELRIATIHLADHGCGDQSPPETIDGPEVWSRLMSSLGRARSFTADCAFTRSECCECSKSDRWTETLPPRDVRQLFADLANEVQVLHLRWAVHRDLFGVDSGEWRQLGAHAWRTLQAALEESLVIKFYRLFDPPQTGRKESASIYRLLKALGTDPKWEWLREQLSEALEVLKPIVELLRDHRHGLAHLSMGHLEGSVSLQPITCDAIDRAWAQLAELFRFIDQQLNGSTTCYEDIALGQGSGFHLMAAFKLGAETQALLRTVRPNRLRPEDFLKQLTEVGRKHKIIIGDPFAEDIS